MRPKEDRGGQTPALITTCGEFTAQVLKKPYYLSLAAVFAAGKCAVNVAMDASWATALRSGLLGLLLYTLACLAVRLLSPGGPPGRPGRRGGPPSPCLPGFC